MQRSRNICLLIIALLSFQLPARPQESTPRPLLPKASYDSLQKHRGEIYDASTKFRADLRLSNQDERVLLHLPRRGFPVIERLYDSGASADWDVFRLFCPDPEMKNFSTEERVAEELLGDALQNQIMATQYARFCLLRELAPSPAALRLEEQAKELVLQFRTGSEIVPTGDDSLKLLASVRKFFNQLKDLPQLTPEEFARECAENSVLTWAECWDDSTSTLSPDKRKWPYIQLDCHSHWDHEGFLLAFSEPSDPDFGVGSFLMVVKPQGGIFETTELRNSDATIPSSYESKLSLEEISGLEDFLKRLPPSNASGEDIRCIISFFEDKIWVTRTYRSLPVGDLLQPLLSRMVRQSLPAMVQDFHQEPEFLAPAR